MKKTLLLIAVAGVILLGGCQSVPRGGKPVIGISYEREKSPGAPDAEIIPPPRDAANLSIRANGFFPGHLPGLWSASH